MTPEPALTGSFKRTVRVNVPIDRAFKVFTEKMGAWWPASHHVGGTPFKDILIDHRAGGRWYEINAKGEECMWGTVVAWEPPRNVVLSWHLQPDWTFSPDLARASEVALEFISEGPERTRVEFEHRHLERFGDTPEAARTIESMTRGWGMILDGYKAEAERAPEGGAAASG